MIEAVPISRCRFRKPSVKISSCISFHLCSCWNLSVSSKLANTKRNFIFSFSCSLKTQWKSRKLEETTVIPLKQMPVFSTCLGTVPAVTCSKPSMD